MERREGRHSNDGAEEAEAVTSVERASDRWAEGAAREREEDRPEASAEHREQAARQEREDAERTNGVREAIADLASEEEEDRDAGASKERRGPHEVKADAMERALGVPIDKKKAAAVLKNSRTLDPVRYFLRAREYTGSLLKAFKMTFTTGGFRDPNRDAVFTNRLNNLAPEETKLHETMHAVSERAGAERGTDVFGAERTVSGIESVDGDGAIRLTGLNEGLTQYFTLRARKELKMRGPKALGAYMREVAVVRDIARILDGAGMDGNKVMAGAFVSGDADGIRKAVEKVGGAGTFDTLTASMDAGDHKGVRRLLSTFEEEE